VFLDQVVALILLDTFADHGLHDVVVVLLNYHRFGERRWFTVSSDTSPQLLELDGFMLLLRHRSLIDIVVLLALLLLFLLLGRALSLLVRWLLHVERGLRRTPPRRDRVVVVVGVGATDQVQILPIEE
jgi:hypothetical protein